MSSAQTSSRRWLPLLALSVASLAFGGLVVLAVPAPRASTSLARPSAPVDTVVVRDPALRRQPTPPALPTRLQPPPPPPAPPAEHAQETEPSSTPPLYE